jgi:hypothetical protein
VIFFLTAPRLICDKWQAAPAVDTSALHADHAAAVQAKDAEHAAVLHGITCKMVPRERQSDKCNQYQLAAFNT